MKTSLTTNEPNQFDTSLRKNFALRILHNKSYQRMRYDALVAIVEKIQQLIYDVENVPYFRFLSCSVLVYVLNTICLLSCDCSVLGVSYRLIAIIASNVELDGDLFTS